MKPLFLFRPSINLFSKKLKCLYIKSGHSVFRTIAQNEKYPKIAQSVSHGMKTNIIFFNNNLKCGIVFGSVGTPACVQQIILGKNFN